jgi:hypothetical protein
MGGWEPQARTEIGLRLFLRHNLEHRASFFVGGLSAGSGDGGESRSTWARPLVELLTSVSCSTRADLMRRDRRTSASK